MGAAKNTLNLEAASSKESVSYMELNFSSSWDREHKRGANGCPMKGACTANQVIRESVHTVFWLQRTDGEDGWRVGVLPEVVGVGVPVKVQAQSSPYNNASN